MGKTRRRRRGRRHYCLRSGRPPSPSFQKSFSMRRDLVDQVGRMQRPFDPMGISVSNRRTKSFAVHAKIAFSVTKPGSTEASAFGWLTRGALDGTDDCAFVADIKEHKSTLRGLCVKLRIDQVFERDPGCTQSNPPHVKPAWEAAQGAKGGYPHPCFRGLKSLSAVPYTSAASDRSFVAQMIRRAVFHTAPLFSNQFWTARLPCRQSEAPQRGE